MSQIREEVSFTKGRIIVRGKLVTRGRAKRADYILYFKPNIPIAVIEAKDNSHSVGDGMQQALDYAETLNVPFAFSSNGDGFVFHDRTGASTPREADLPLDAFPSPADLWARYRAWKGLTPEAEEIVLQDYFEDGSGKTPRYYQANAVNAAIEAIAKGQNRILLVMATGTGKTYTAFQIIWRLWKARRKKRILFLADRTCSSTRRWRTISALRRHDDEALTPHRHRLRGLSRPLSGDHRAGGTPEGLPEVLAGVLRSDRDRRMPPRQCRRRFSVARDPRVLLLRNPDRPHGHAEGDEVRLQRRYFGSRSTPTP